MATINEVNQKVLNFFTGIEFLNAIGWLVFGIVIIGASVYGYWYYINSRKFNKKITAFEIIGINFQPAIRDTAKVVKLGKGGFEILYLKKSKTWKIAYGGRVGKNDYYFFIMPDGYWYNGMLSANLHKIDEQKGLIPIVTTNPSMRSQYTSLEKQIDSLHQEKKSFMDKYGVWVFSIGFLIIAGIMLWLNYKQYVIATSNLNSVSDKFGIIADKLSTALGNARGIEGSGGLVPQ